MSIPIPDGRTALHVGGTALLVALVLPFVVFAGPQLVGADASYVVLSDSMSPTIRAGDAVIVRDISPDSVEQDDIITFERPAAADSDPGDPAVTHRVITVVEKDGERHFRTKGDANEQADDHLVPPENVQGEVILTIPYLGYAVTYANSDAGLLLLVIGPAVAIGLSELWGLAAAIRASRGSASSESRETSVEPLDEEG